MEGLGVELFRNHPGALSVHGRFNPRRKQRTGCTARCSAAIIRLAPLLPGADADGCACNRSDLEDERKRISKKDFEYSRHRLGQTFGPRTKTKGFGGRRITDRS